jgi:tetratricopeptide (TPR) repeat protein
MCLTVLARLHYGCGRRRQALATYKQAVGALKADPHPSDTECAVNKADASWSLGLLLNMSGRLEEAAAALQEADEALRGAGIRRRNPGPLVWLTNVYAANGQCRRAIECGAEAERALQLYAPSITTASTDAEGARARDDALMQQGPTKTSGLWYVTLLYSALAYACERQRDVDGVAKYHRAAMTACEAWGAYPTMMMTCFARLARGLYATGELAKAVQHLEVMLLFYRKQVERPGGLAQVDGQFSQLLPMIKDLLVIKRELGKTIEADAVLRDLEESEAVLRAQVVSAWEELQEEMSP